MPGSRRWYKYTADDATVYAIELDKQVAAAGGFTEFGALDTAPPMPQGMRPRYVNATHAASGAKRRVPMATTSVDAWTGAATSVSLFDYTASPPALADFDITSRIGQRSTRTPHSDDTGLTV